MKNTCLLISLFSFLSPVLLAQNEDGKKVELQLKQRIGFYAVDNRYNLLTDTIYHSDDGFRVFSGYDVQDIDGVEYVIFRYPRWKKKEQKKEKQLVSQQSSSVFQQYAKVMTDLSNQIKKGKNTAGDSAMLSLDTFIEVEENFSDKPVHVDIVGRDSLLLAMPKEDFDRIKLEGNVQDVFSLKWRHSTSLASGFMTVPFKLRPAQDSVNFNITTDVTLGAYLGVKKRISRQGNNFIVLPVTLGLSYINVGNSETSNVNTTNSSAVIPGWTWSSGVVFDLNGFNVGFVLGQDFASGVGKDWLYNKKLWYSFSIGYSFFNKSKK